MRCRVERGDFPPEPFEAALEVLRALERDDDPRPPTGDSHRRALAKIRRPLRLV